MSCAPLGEGCAHVGPTSITAGEGVPFAPPSLRSFYVSDVEGLNISLLRCIKAIGHLQVFQTRWVLTTASRKLSALLPMKIRECPQCCSENRGHQMSLFLYPAEEAETHRSSTASSGLPNQWGVGLVTPLSIFTQEECDHMSTEDRYEDVQSSLIHMACVIK